MLPAEGAQGKWMSVRYHDLRGKHHPRACVSPSIAKFAILPRGRHKGGIKAPYGSEAICRDGQIIGREESCCMGKSIIVGVQVHDEQVAGGRAIVAGECSW